MRRNGPIRQNIDFFCSNLSLNLVTPNTGTEKNQIYVFQKFDFQFGFRSTLKLQ